MNKLNLDIQNLKTLKNKFSDSSYGDFDNNRDLFNQLKEILIAYGYDTDVVLMDSRNKFFTPPLEHQRLYGAPKEDFKDDKGKLVALCTKCIRELRAKVEKNDKKNKSDAQLETITVENIVYPPTSWNLLRNGIFWTIFLAILSLSCTAFYFIGQNSKDKENAELVVENNTLSKQLSEKRKDFQALKNENEKYIQLNIKMEKELSSLRIQMLNKK
jgi:hypothetical protein